MKKIIGIVMLAMILALGSCKPEHGRGPVLVEASYPGEFQLTVGMYNGDGVQEENIFPNPSTSFSASYYDGLELWYIGVSANKVGDSGLLEVTVTGSFGVLHDTRPVGDTRPILLSKEWDPY